MSSSACGISSRFFPALAGVVSVVVLAVSRPLEAQLFINEVIAENSSEEPADIGEAHTDMIEIYNDSDEIIPLGSSSSANSYFLSSTTTFDAPQLSTTWKFPPARSNIPPKGFLVIFADNNGFEGLCELHSSFGINNNGTEPLTLWGPEPSAGAPRPIIDQVWLPPLRNNVSFGRFPDGAGPAPVPLEDTFNVFNFNPPGTSTFGNCSETGSMPGCPGNIRRTCLGAPNGPGGNLEPRVDRLSHTTNHPAANEAVTFVVMVEDDEEPTSNDIAGVQIRFAVDGVEQDAIDMTYDVGSGVQTGASMVPPRPLERWTLWRGTIPGQPAGVRVDFVFYVEDVPGLSSTDPRVICTAGNGPCNSVGLPGPGCVIEDCAPGPMEGCQFVTCELRHQYLVGYTPPAPLSSVLINEVVADQNSILRDRTDLPCPENNPNCGYDDFIEICNGSDQPVDLSGHWLSDAPFHPHGWQFPADSIIQPGQYIIVWTDNDGGKCPHPPELTGDGQECPDPNDADTDYHTNFALDADGDQIYLFSPQANGFGVVHGHEFGPQALNVSLSLKPDCTRSGSYLATPGGSPRAPNPCPPEPMFRRGDANGDGSVNITDPTYTLNFLFLGGPQPDCPDAADADNSGGILLTDPVYSLNFLFLGGPRPPSPGPIDCGPDPSSPADTLGECTAACKG